MVKIDEISWEDVEVGKDSPETLSFKTYKNYLITLSSLIEINYDENPLIKLKILMEKKLSKGIERKKGVNLEKIRSLLINSWHTELNFLLPMKIGGDFTRYSIHWAPVQAYYSIYLSLRALMESCNNPISNTHRATLSAISNWIIERDVIPYPWSCSCTNMENPKYGGFKEKIEYVNPLCIPNSTNLEHSYAMFLRTTRKIKFEKRKSEIKLKTKRDKIKKRFTKQDKKKIEAGLHATTFFDCFYRLRTKSNYEEAETYVLSDLVKIDLDNFYYSLKKILTSTLFILESIIAKYLGLDEFNKMIDDFTKKIAREDLKEEGIFERKQYF